MCFQGAANTFGGNCGRTDDGYSVMSVKGKKVLHIDRNDHYGGFVVYCPSLEIAADDI